MRCVDEKVSIIVPIYNSEKYICSCVDSVVHQTYTNIEIILIDDASDDASLEICLEYAQTDSRIVVLHNEKNGGPSASRERGYRVATGEWICFVDHDDCMESHAIERLISATDEGTEIIAGKYRNVLSRYFERHEWDTDSKTKTVILEYDDALNALESFGENEVAPCLWGKLYRRELLNRVETVEYKNIKERFPLIYFEDVILIPLLMKECRKLKIVEQCMYAHRIDYHSASMSLHALETNLQAARTADIVMNWLDEPYARGVYIAYMQSYLLIFSKNWYFVWRYYDKDAALLDEMEALFDKYYVIYRKLNVRTFSVTDICIRLFRLNKVFFCITVCPVWFGFGVKLRHRLLSK